jgi:hypothetical protein
MGAYTKTIVAALMAGLTAVITVLSTDPSASKWVTVAIAAANVIMVFVAPNLPKAATAEVTKDLEALAALMRTSEPQVNPTSPAVTPTLAAPIDPA